MYFPAQVTITDEIQTFKSVFYMCEVDTTIFSAYFNRVIAYGSLPYGVKSSITYNEFEGTENTCIIFEIERPRQRYPF